MDWVSVKKHMIQLFERYKYVLLIVVLGLALMMLPETKPQTEIPQTIQKEQFSDPEEELEEILGQIQGVGRIRVMLTQDTGSVTHYQTDQDTGSDGSIRTETVIVSDENRAESGMVRTVVPPTYLGAIVVCQGGDNASVRYNLIQAVSAVTGISSDRITVLKMK